MKRLSLLPLAFSIFLYLFIPLKAVQMAALFLLLLYGFSFILSRYMRASLKVERARLTQFCPNGSDEQLEFSVINRGFLPMSQLIILDSGNGCYSADTGTFLSDLPGRSTRTYRCPIQTMVRGKFHVGPVKIKGSDPLNFFPWEKTFPLYSSVVVYPAGHSLSLLLSEGERGGSVQSPSIIYEDRNQLKGIRDYRAGDPLKRINWKASARTGTLKTMEYSNTLDAPLLILLDISPVRYPLKHRYILLERAIEAAASLIISYGEAKQKISLLVKGAENPVFVPFGRGFGHMVYLLEELAQISFSDEGGEESIIDYMMSRRTAVECGTHISLLVPALDEGILSGMELLFQRRTTLQLIATGGVLPQGIPPYCRGYTLSEYGQEYYA